jgi:hypothetical protein
MWFLDIEGEDEAHMVLRLCISETVEGRREFQEGGQIPR